MEDAASEVNRVPAFPALCHAASPSVAPQPNASTDVLGAPCGERISNSDATRPADSKPMHLTAVVAVSSGHVQAAVHTEAADADVQTNARSAFVNRDGREG
jgi:hypothetical protein